MNMLEKTLVLMIVVLMVFGTFLTATLSITEIGTVAGTIESIEIKEKDTVKVKVAPSAFVADKDSDRVIKPAAKIVVKIPYDNQEPIAIGDIIFLRCSKPKMWNLISNSSCYPISLIE